ncbi:MULTISPECIES: hypothetical protein [Halorussus]|uniref:hypothetical protein n=1 Tax=Halorussus TaxID=1070314 RepID=UPI0020A21362|nr:hypothetical protein [Halorussus vallis]USZ78623.1 hypothetical protein NGM07_25070 [Halorussus vallis]
MRGKVGDTHSWGVIYDSDRDPIWEYVESHAQVFRYLELGLWTLAILFGLGDVLTTLIGVTPVFGGPYDGLYESVALTRWLLDAFGPWTLFPKKAVMLGIVTLIWHVFPKPYRLVLVGGAVVGNYLLFWGNFQLLIEVGAVSLPF